VKKSSYSILEDLSFQKLKRSADRLSELLDMWVIQAGWTFTEGGVLFSLAPESQDHRKCYVISDKHRRHLDQCSRELQHTCVEHFEGLFNILVNIYLRIC